MDYIVFRELLPKIKNIALPGEEAHFAMEPPMRRQFHDKDLILKRNPREAAVSALFYPKGEKTFFLLILRKSYPGVHSNQIGFPGGKVEPEDNDLWHTALRETEEEVGVLRAEVELLKKLTKLYIPPSNFWVQPYMAFSKAKPKFVKQESEVEEILEIPLAGLLNESLLVTKELSTSYAKNMQVPAFLFNGHVVWGATAMILNEIKTIVKPLL